MILGKVGQLVESNGIVFCGLIAVDVVFRGKVAKVWQVEPLCAIVTPSGIELIPEIEYLKARVSTLERALVELKTIVE